MLNEDIKLITFDTYFNRMTYSEGVHQLKLNILIACAFCIINKSVILMYHLCALSRDQHKDGNY